MTASPCELAVPLRAKAVVYLVDPAAIDAAVPLDAVLQGVPYIRVCTASYRLEHGTGYDLIPEGVFPPDVMMVVDADRDPHKQISEQLDRFSDWARQSRLCRHVIGDVRTQFQARQRRLYPQITTQIHRAAEKQAA